MSARKSRFMFWLVLAAGILGSYAFMRWYA